MNRQCDLAVRWDSQGLALCGKPAAGPDPIWPEKWLCRDHLALYDWQEVDDWLNRDGEEE